MVRRLLVVLAFLFAILFHLPVSGGEPAAIEEALPATGDVAWDQLGVKLEVVGSSAVSQAHRDLHGGMRVVAIRPASPAAAGKIQVGDILVGLHHWETTTRDSVPFTLGYVRGAGMQSLNFVVVRENQICKGEFRLSPEKAK